MNGTELIRGMRFALREVRQMHRQACERIVADVKAGRITPETGHLDLQSVTEQIGLWRRPEALVRHDMISQDAFQALKLFENS